MVVPAVPHLIWMREEEIWLSSSLRASAWEDFLVLEWVWAEKNKTQNKGAKGEARCLSAGFGEATICLTNGVPWVRPSGLGL